jgi:N-acetylated-alpha-linked acidic dipeptidase
LGKKATNVEFSSLRASIKNLQEISLKLDQEKFDAEKDFKKLLERLPFPGRRHHGRCRKRSGVLRQVADWIKGVFGVSPPTESELQLLSLRTADSLEEYFSYVSTIGDDDLETHTNWPFLNHRLIKAAKRVSRANKKLIIFERGFISEEGIKEREWYKHLGVAPGKWLGKRIYRLRNYEFTNNHSIGYGATTFPALTETITLEKNVTLIYHEAKRLQTLLDKLANDIAP